MTLAKTEAAGGPGLLPEVLAFSSSLSLDRQLLDEDLVGLAGPRDDARAAPASFRWPRRGPFATGWWPLVAAPRRATLELPDEEDVHMAVEVELNRTIGAPAALLHSARSRNDQVATDLRLHVREAAAEALAGAHRARRRAVTRARAERDVLLPSYTHRQRAQPVSLAYWLRSLRARPSSATPRPSAFVLEQADAAAAGRGRHLRHLAAHRPRGRRGSCSAFEGVTLNGLDTVGDRDFALDYLYATARFFVHASRLSTDLIDFTTAEFGFASLSGDIAWAAR